MIEVSEQKRKEIEATNIRNQIMIQKQVILSETNKKNRNTEYNKRRISNEYKNLGIMKARLSKVFGEIQGLQNKERLKQNFLNIKK